jgi:anion-transporting  ArsA/GET3 family ATPase
MRLAAPVLFLNLATLPGACPLCAALRQREAAVRKQFQETFPNARQVLVHRHRQPQGLEALRTLGQALYEPNGATAPIYA